MQIAVIGGGFTGLSMVYRLREAGLKPTLFERDQLGGLTRTIKHSDHLLELGAEAFLVRDPEMLLLASKLGIEPILARPASKKRYIVKGGLLLRIPESPMQLLMSSLFFFPDKFKILKGISKSFSVWDTMSLFDFFRHAFSNEVAELLASSMARGIFGCEAQDLEFKAAFPELFSRLESGESIKMAIKNLSNERKALWKNSFSKFTPGLYSFKNGLSELPEAIAKALKENGVEIKSGNVTSLQITNKGISVFTPKQKVGPFDKVVMAVDHFSASNIIREANKELSNQLRKLPISPISVVHCGWNPNKFSASGFGFLSPQREKLNILGTLFPSNMFPDRFSKKEFVTKTMIQGESKLLNDDDFHTIIYQAHKKLFRLSQPANWIHVQRYDGIPRYFPGYSRWRESINKMKDPRIYFTGWSFSGVGLPQSLQASSSVVDLIKSREK